MNNNVRSRVLVALKQHVFESLSDSSKYILRKWSDKAKQNKSSHWFFIFYSIPWYRDPKIDVEICGLYYDLEQCNDKDYLIIQDCIDDPWAEEQGFCEYNGNKGNWVDNPWSIQSLYQEEELEEIKGLLN